MQRRSFLLAASAAAAAAGVGTAVWRWQEITAQARYPGRAEGHFLRAHWRAPQALPPPSAQFETDVVILGSGIAGLTAAWKLEKTGHREHLLIDGPEPDGNAAGGRHGALAYPTGAHYLPLPSTESFHVREILQDLGILLRDADSDRPYYDERAILHAPEERLLVAGRWQDGLVPAAAAGSQEALEQARFFAEVERLKNLRGADGRRAFVFPSALSSADAQFAALDRISFAHWLDRNGYRAPGLRWYVNYACRDDFGAGCEQVSAWAGLHYFCARDGQAQNAGNGAWLTWPGGLQALATGLREKGGKRHLAGSAVSLQVAGTGVEALCLRLVDGKPQTFRVRARRAICAMPLRSAGLVVADMQRFGFDSARDAPAASSWLVANFLMRRFPEELPEAPLGWDNVVLQEPGLGYVVSTHQDIRVQPPQDTVFTAYVALSHLSPAAARAWLDAAPVDELLALAAADLRAAYGWQFAGCVERVDITVRGHAMAIPAPGFRSNAARLALQRENGPILFAHADLSSFSVFEEASWWGYLAAQRATA